MLVLFPEGWNSACRLGRREEGKKSEGGLALVGWVEEETVGTAVTVYYRIDIQNYIV